MHAEKHVKETAQETGECMKAFASFLLDFSFPPSNILAPHSCSSRTRKLTSDSLSNANNTSLIFHPDSRFGGEFLKEMR